MPLVSPPHAQCLYCTDLVAYVKAAARDIKAYLKAAGSNALVGYAAVDGDAAFRNTVAQYMACGNDSVTVDLYGRLDTALQLRPC